MEKIKKLNIITSIVLIGFITAVVYHYVLGTVFHLGYPHNTFLFALPFCDFYANYYGFFPEPIFNPYLQFKQPSNYFPFAMLTLFLFRLIPYVFSFLFFYAITINYFVFYIYKNIKNDLPPNLHSKVIISTIILSFLTYPFLLLTQVGNNDFLIFIFISLSVYFFIKEKYILSALLLSLPIAMKAFALILIPLFIMKKKYKEVFYCLASVFLLTLISLILAEGGFMPNIIWFLSKHLPYYSQEYIIKDSGMVCNSSLFGVIKIIIYTFNDALKPSFISLGSFIKLPILTYYSNADIYDIVSKALKFYLPVTALITLTTAVFVTVSKMELWKKILLLLICSVLFTPVASDNKLINLFIPLCLFLNSQNKSKADILYAILFGLILIPKNYLQFIIPTNCMHFDISVIINPIILLIMYLTVFIDEFYLRQKERSINETS